MASINKDSDVTPDSLMDVFKGMGLKPVLIFTVVVHVVVILGSSIPFFVRKAFSADQSKKSEADRIESAVEDATEALRKIAKKHDLNPQDISDQFSGGGSRAGKTTTADAAAVTNTAAGGTDEAEPPPEREKSAYETNLEVKVEGPSVPTLESDKDAIF